MTTRTPYEWIAISRAIRNIETMVSAQTEMMTAVFKQQQAEIARLEHQLADKSTNT